MLYDFCYEMNGIKKIRIQIGISQQDLADYLDVVRSAVALAETERQQLPANALLKLDELYLKISPNNEGDNHLIATELSEQQNELQHFLQEDENINAKKVKQLQTQLNETKNNFAKAMHLLRGVRSLQQQLPNTVQHKKDLLWLAVIEAEAIEKIKSNGLVEQQKLQTKINALS